MKSSLWIRTIASLLVFLEGPYCLEAADQGDYYDLLDYLFTDYRQEVRPVNDDGNATKVIIVCWLLSVINMDEKNQIFEAAVTIEMSWLDEWLFWEPSQYGNITRIRYPQKKLWLPDVVVMNSVESQTQLGYNESPCEVLPDGQVTWRPSEVLKTSCDMDVTYYPFDTQSCSIVLSTWVSITNEIDLDIDDNITEIVLDKYSPSGTWELVSSSMDILPDEESLSRVQYTFKLKRLSTFYVLNVILPILFLSMTASAVFYLPADSGEKIGMSITVLLAFAVYLTIISENMPQTSLRVSILSVYLAILLGACGFIVVVSVFILHIYHRPDDRKVGKRTEAFTRKMRKFRSRSRNDESQKAGKEKAGSDEKSSLSKRKPLITSIETYMAKNLNTQPTKRNGKVSPYQPINDKVEQNRNNSTNFKSYEVEKGKKEEDEEEEITWHIVAETLDGVFFVCCSGFILLLTTVVMVVLVYGSQRQI